MEPVTSAIFIKKPPTSGKEKTLYEISKVLMNRLFLGIYYERRYVDRLKKYRDVVMISPAETGLLTDLKKIKCCCNKYYEAEWVGITGPEFEEGTSGFCFWVKLPNVPFGHFWFQIKEIIFEEGEVMLRLKCIRSVHLQDFEDVVKKGNKKIEGEANKERNEQSSQFSDSKRIRSLICLHLKDAIQEIQQHLTWKNFVLISKFIFAITFVLVTTVATFIRYMGDYVLKLIREFALILHVISPILIQIIDCFTKVIGGFFILIVLMFKNQTNNVQLLQNRFQSQHEGRMLPLKSLPSPPPQITVPKNWRERNRILKTQLLSEK